MSTLTLRHHAGLLTLLGALVVPLGCDNAERSTAPPAAAAPPEFSVSPGGGTWATEAPMPTGRYWPAAGVVHGILYVAGGRDSASVYLATVEAYDPATNVWNTKASMPTGRWALGVGVVSGTLYAVGGVGPAGVLATVEAYDPGTDSWTSRAPLPTARAGLAVAVVNGTLYAIGGQNSSGAAVATVEAYDPAANAWTTLASMPTARWGLATGVVNGVIYAVGGSDGSSNLATVQAYDPATNTWTTKAAMPTARGALAADVVDGVVYAVGGYSTNELATVEAYDPIANAWSTQASMPTARSGLAVGAVAGVLYAVGGDGLRYLATNEALRPGTLIFEDGFESGDNTWTQVPENGRYSVVDTVAHSGTHSLQVLFDTTAGGAYGLITRWFGGQDEVYVEFYVKFQGGFENQRPDHAGMHFLTMCGDSIDGGRSCWGKPGVRPTGTDFFYAGVDPEEVSLPSLQPLSFYTYWPDMTCPPDYPAEACYGNVFAQSSPKVPLDTTWQQVVFHVKMNTPLQSDGSQELWVNGVQKISVQNMRWRTTAGLTINEIIFFNYMDKAPQVEYLWIDDVTVWRP